MTPDDEEDVEREQGRTLKARRRAPEETKSPPSRALVLVPVWKRQVRVGDKTKPFPQVHSPENRLAEAIGLAERYRLSTSSMRLSCRSPSRARRRSLVRARSKN